MLKIYIKTAWRQLTKNRLSAFVNIAGLSIGMAAAALILLWVQNEMSYDNFHPDASRIFIVNTQQGKSSHRYANTPGMLAIASKQRVPEIENAARLLTVQSQSLPVISIESRHFKEKQLAYVDKEWFDIFRYNFIEGEPADFTSISNGIILTETLARKYYGKKKAVGQIIFIDSSTYQVRGVVKNNPTNSSFQFNILLPLETYIKTDPNGPAFPESFAFQTFIKIKETASKTNVEKKLSNLLFEQDFIHEMFKDTIKTGLTALSEMHFDEGITGNSQLQYGDKQSVLVFSFLGFLLLTIACINYVNLTTARASRRIKEISIKKIMGATRQVLFMQVIAESFANVLLALIITVCMIRISLPFFNRFTDTNFTTSFFSQNLWKILGSTLMITVLLTGIYPALLLSSFKPLNVLKGVQVLNLKRTALRKILVVMQFTLATALMTCTGIILKQLYFIQSQNDGYDRKQIFSISLPSSWEKEHMDADKKGFFSVLKNELSAHPGITNVTISNDAIQNIKMSVGGAIDWNGRQKGDDRPFTPISVDPDFDKTFKLEMKEGRWFQKDDQHDRHNYILNETAIEALGLKKPWIGQYFAMFGDTGQIIGIAKDFHFRNFRQKIGIAVIAQNPFLFPSTFFIEAANTRTKQAIAGAEITWKKFFPEVPFEYNFMDDEFREMYKSDNKFSRLIALFSGLAIFISCIGLLGLVTITVEQRTKEIGIRKVLGASSSGITFLLSKDFIRLVIVSIFIATPIAWLAMSKWLETFAYRIEINWLTFAESGAAAILIALITVSANSIKAAMANPVNSLRASE